MENNLPNTQTPLASTPTPMSPPVPGMTLPQEPPVSPIMPNSFTPPPITPVEPIPQYSPPAQQTQQTGTPGNKKNTALIASLAAVALVVLVVALYVFAMKKNTPTTATNYNNSATQTVTPTLTPVPTVSSPQSDAAAAQGLDTGDPTQDLQTISSDLSQL